MNNFIIKSGRLFRKYRHLSLVTIVINMNGNSKYVENMNNFEKGGEE